MNAIDREKLLEWLEIRIAHIAASTSDYDKGLHVALLMVRDQVKSGAFDIKPPKVPELQPGDKVRHKTKQTVYLGEVIGVAKGKARVKWMSYNTNVFWKRAPQPKWYAIEELVKVEDATHD